MSCLFCRTENDLTDEHVFPAVLGGDVVIKDGSCKKCNAECGRFEQRFARDVLSIRHLLEIADRYGEVPAAKVVAAVKDVQVPARRDAEGNIQLHDFVTRAQMVDGKTERHGLFMSEEAAQRFVERARKRGEKLSVEDIRLPEQLEVQSVSTQTLEFAFSGAARRVVAKVALVALAFKYGLNFALDKQFDRLRRAIVSADMNSLDVRIFANAAFATSEIRNPRHHSVVTHLNADMHKGWSLVALFGGLAYAIQLTTEYAERDSRSFSLHYDTATKNLFNPVVLYDEHNLIGQVLSPTTKFESQQAVDEQWYPIIEADCMSRGVDISRLRPAPAKESEVEQPNSSG